MLTETLEGNPIPIMCQFCGRGLKRIEKYRRGRPRRFCNSVCQMRAWRRDHPRKKLVNVNG